jgi:hypothetical protein
VTWRFGVDYIGWAPLGADGFAASVPGGAYQYVPRSQLASTDLSSHALRARDLGARVSDATPIDNTDVRGGVTFNRGPSIESIERATGPLTRVRIDDLLQDAPADTSTAPDLRSRVGAAQRAGEQVAREARQIADLGSRPPSRLPVVRPLGVPREREPAREAPRDRVRRAAPADTTKK